MPPDGFDDFVKRQQTTEDLNRFWSGEKDQYLNDLEQLYDTILGYLNQYIKSETIRYDKYVRIINEENTGPYEAPGLILKIGKQTVKFDPVGTQIIGAKGRVDVTGTAGRSRIVRVNADLDAPRVNITIHVEGRTPVKSAEPTEHKPITWEWRIVDFPPQMKFIELNQDNLMKMLMAVSNG